MLPRYYKSLDLGCSFINLKYLGISHQFLHRIFSVEPSASKYLSNNKKYIEFEAFMTDTGCNIFVVDHPCQFLADATLFPDDSGGQGLPRTLHICSELTWLVTQRRSKRPNDKIRKTSEPLKTWTFFRNTTNWIRQKWEWRLGSKEKGESSSKLDRTLCQQITGYQHK